MSRGPSFRVSMGWDRWTNHFPIHTVGAKSWLWGETVDDSVTDRPNSWLCWYFVPHTSIFIGIFPFSPFPIPISHFSGPFATRLVKRHIDRPMFIIVSLGLVDGQPPTIVIPKIWLSIVHRYSMPGLAGWASDQYSFLPSPYSGIVGSVMAWICSLPR